MGESGSATDAVIFFDANMPGLQCRGNCENDESVLCIHRLNFRAHLEYWVPNLYGKNDFQVLEIFLNLIHEQEWCSEEGEAIFVLVTRDRNFLTKDVPRDYKAAVNAGTKIRLSFNSGSVSDGRHKVVVVVVREAEDERIRKQDYQMDHDDILRCTIRKLNELWASRQDS